MPSANNIGLRLDRDAQMSGPHVPSRPGDPPAPADSEPATLERLNVRPTSKRAEHLAAQIESEIVRARWPIGLILGTEPQLLARYSVSRSVLREAVRILEHHRVAEMRMGPAGGLAVTAPDGESFRRAATLYLDYQNVSMAELFETRIALELLAVDRATRLLDEAGIGKLRAALAADAPASYPRHGHGQSIHNAIAELSGSPTVALFVDVLLMLTEQQFGPEETAAAVAHVAASEHAHRAIVEAVVDGDVALARHRMRRHVTSLGKFLEDGH